MALQMSELRHRNMLQHNTITHIFLSRDKIGSVKKQHIALLRIASKQEIGSRETLKPHICFVVPENV